MKFNDLFIAQSHALTLPPRAFRVTIKILRLSTRKARLTGWHGDRTIPKSAQLRYWITRSATVDWNETWIVNKSREGCSIEIVSDSTCCPSFQRGYSAWMITASAINPQLVMGDDFTSWDKDNQCSCRSDGLK